MLSLTDLIALTRSIAQDSDTSEKGLTDSNWTSLINEAYFDYMAEVDNAIAEIGTVTLRIAPDPLANITNDSHEIVLKAGQGLPRKILRAEDASPEALERLEVPELIALRAGSPSGMPTSGNPAFWAIEKLATDPAKWVVYFHPRTTIAGDENSSDITFYGECHPLALDGTDSNYMFLSSLEEAWVCRIAAARGAALLGRPGEFIAGIVRDIPKNIALGQSISAQYLLPRPRTGEEPV